MEGVKGTRASHIARQGSLPFILISNTETIKKEYNYATSKLPHTDALQRS